MAAKQLILLRHSFTESSNERPDILRELTPKGFETVKQVSAQLAIWPVPQVAYASPAKRTIQTLHALNNEWQLGEHLINICRPLYYGNAHDYLSLIELIPDQFNVACIVAHNPMISYLSQTLCPGFHNGFAPCSALILESSIESWSLANRTWDLKHFIDSTSQLPENE